MKNRLQISLLSLTAGISTVAAARLDETFQNPPEATGLEVDKHPCLNLTTLAFLRYDFRRIELYLNQRHYTPIISNFFERDIPSWV